MIALTFHQITPGWHRLLFLAVLILCIRIATNLIVPKRIKVSRLEALVTIHFLAFAIACFAWIYGSLNTLNHVYSQDAETFLISLSTLLYRQGIFLAVTASVLYSLLLVIGEIRSKRAGKKAAT